MCPGNRIFFAGTCVCGAGKTLRNNQCVDACRPGQLEDASGNCYTCPINEVAQNDRCVCKPGYQRNGLFCELQCSANEIVINGRCAVCALNTVFDAKAGACVCKEGFFMNTAGVCEQIILPPVTCRPDQYYSSTLGCLACPAGCASCNNANVCTSCVQEGYAPVGAVCQPKCGDGIKLSFEACDDGNSRSGDGCSATCQ